MVTKDMPKTPTISLREVYRDWKHTQSLLAKVRQQAPELSPMQVHIVLENAVMYRLLHNSRPTVQQLFAEVDAEAIQRGFNEIGRPFDAHLSAKILNIFATPWPVVQSNLPTVERTDAAIRFGEFEQPLVTPVRRLLSFAQERFSAQNALRYVARCSMRYASIFAKTRHIGPPQVVYDDFYDWGVRNEGFASPFNARMLGKPSGKFFSAFADTDGVFGSQGSLFQARREDHPGAWCLDPPFLPETMARTVQTIERWRAEADCPAILLIVPSSFQPAYAPDETVLLQAGHHCYTGLDGQMNLLPVDVSIHRFGTLAGFDSNRIQRGYLPQ